MRSVRRFCRSGDRDRGVIVAAAGEIVHRDIQIDHAVRSLKAEDRCFGILACFCALLVIEDRGRQDLELEAAVV